MVIKGCLSLIFFFLAFTVECEKGNKVEGLKKMSKISTSKGLERQKEVQREKDKEIEEIFLGC